MYAGDNHLYVGTYDGIRCIDLSTDDFKTEEILSRHIIHSLYEDPQGNIWIGNSEGLAEWNPQTQQLKTYTTAHGLSSNAVYAIKGDGQDNLWISTNAGMSRFNLNTHTFSNFYADDGLQGNEFSKTPLLPTTTAYSGLEVQMELPISILKRLRIPQKMERTHHRLLSARPAHKERNVVGRKRNHKHLRL